MNHRSHNEAAGKSNRGEWSIGFLLVLAVTVGLMTGLAEVIYRIKQVYVRHVFVWQGRQAIWMVSVAEGLFFLLVGLVSVALGYWFAGLRTTRGAVAILTTLAMFSLLHFYGRLHPISNMLLAAGAGAVFSRIVDRWPELFRRAVLLSAFVSTVLVAACLSATTACPLLANDLRWQHCGLLHAEPLMYS